MTTLSQAPTSFPLHLLSRVAQTDFVSRGASVGGLPSPSSGRPCPWCMELEQGEVLRSTSADGCRTFQKEKGLMCQSTQVGLCLSNKHAHITSEWLQATQISFS